MVQEMIVSGCWLPARSRLSFDSNPASSDVLKRCATLSLLLPACDTTSTAMLAPVMTTFGGRLRLTVTSTVAWVKPFRNCAAAGAGTAAARQARQTREGNACEILLLI